MKTTLAVAAFALVVEAGTASAASTAPTVTVANPSLNVNVTNNPLPVSVTNATTNQNVTVTNPADIAKALGVQNAYSTEIQCEATNGPCVATFTAPSNQRLVLEYVGLHCGIAAPDQLTTVSVTATNAGTSIRSFIGFNSVVQGPVNSQSATQLTRIYVDAGTTVTVTFALSANTTANCGGGIQGQAINVP